MTSCAGCGQERPLTNLTRLELSGESPPALTKEEFWCPECLYAKAEREMKHQVLEVSE
jgi:hypothetical protein